MKRTVNGYAGALWGLAGVAALLGSATWRLGRLALPAVTGDLSGFQLAALAAVVLFMAYAEGYRGFQRGFSPRVAARARYLLDHPRTLHVLLAPFFCMGYFHATRRRQRTSILLTVGIIGLVLAVRLLPQPWRGIVDAGVVVGLAWGLLSVLGFGLKALTQKAFPHSPEVTGQ